MAERLQLRTSKGNILWFQMEVESEKITLGCWKDNITPGIEEAFDLIDKLSIYGSKKGIKTEQWKRKFNNGRRSDCVVFIFDDPADCLVFYSELNSILEVLKEDISKADADLFSSCLSDAPPVKGYRYRTGLF